MARAFHLVWLGWHDFKVMKLYCGMEDLIVLVDQAKTTFSFILMQNAKPNHIEHSWAFLAIAGTIHCSAV